MKIFSLTILKRMTLGFFMLAACFLSPTDPLLNQRADEVSISQIGSEEIEALIESMYSIAFSNTQDFTKSILVGLAAPQIGVMKRVILVDLNATGVFKQGEPQKVNPPNLCVFINPTILTASRDMEVWREGCFSCDSHLVGVVPRHETITVRAFDRKGNLQELTVTGYTARIFQHEMDHLEGIRFPDRVSNNAHLHWLEEEEKVDYRINWSRWEKFYSRDRWLQEKSGKPS
jgi:peptide deformylase